jgi:hypothetical protein
LHDADRIADGADSERLLVRLKPLIVKQREAAIERLIAHHNSETLTDGIMRSLIATLAALDALERDLAHRVRLGQKDLQELQRG